MAPFRSEQQISASRSLSAPSPGLGDLAIERDEESALAGISSAPGNT